MGPKHGLKNTRHPLLQYASCVPKVCPTRARNSALALFRGVVRSAASFGVIPAEQKLRFASTLVTKAFRYEVVFSTLKRNSVRPRRSRLLVVFGDAIYAKNNGAYKARGYPGLSAIGESSQNNDRSSLCRAQVARTLWRGSDSFSGHVLLPPHVFEFVFNEIYLSVNALSENSHQKSATVTKHTIESIDTSNPASKLIVFVLQKLKILCRE